MTQVVHPYGGNIFATAPGGENAKLTASDQVGFAVKAVNFKIGRDHAVIQMSKEAAARAHLPDVPPEERKWCRKSEVCKITSAARRGHRDDFVTVLAASKFKEPPK